MGKQWPHRSRKVSAEEEVPLRGHPEAKAEERAAMPHGMHRIRAGANISLRDSVRQK